MDLGPLQQMLVHLIPTLLAVGKRNCLRVNAPVVFHAILRTPWGQSKEGTAEDECGRWFVREDGGEAFEAGHAELVIYDQAIDIHVYSTTSGLDVSGGGAGLV